LWLVFKKLRVSATISKKIVAEPIITTIISHPERLLCPARTSQGLYHGDC